MSDDDQVEPSGWEVVGAIGEAMQLAGSLFAELMRRAPVGKRSCCMVEYADEDGGQAMVLMALAADGDRAAQRAMLERALASLDRRAT